MAEEPQGLIFPSIRISDLKREAEISRERFDNSYAVLKEHVVENMNPVSLVKNNLPKVFGIASSIAAVGTMLGFMGKSKAKKEILTKASGFGFTKNVLAWSAAWALRVVAPFLMTIVKDLLHSALDGKSRR